MHFRALGRSKDRASGASGARAVASGRAPGPGLGLRDGSGAVSRGPRPEAQTWRPARGPVRGEGRRGAASREQPERPPLLRERRADWPRRRGAPWEGRLSLVTPARPFSASRASRSVSGERPRGLPRCGTGSPGRPLPGLLALLRRTGSVPALASFSPTVNRASCLPLCGVVCED